jgi:hypothetical protein
MEQYLGMMSKPREADMTKKRYSMEQIITIAYEVRVVLN